MKKNEVILNALLIFLCVFPVSCTKIQPLAKPEKEKINCENVEDPDNCALKQLIASYDFEYAATNIIKGKEYKISITNGSYTFSPVNLVIRYSINDIAEGSYMVNTYLDSIENSQILKLRNGSNRITTIFDKEKLEKTEGNIGVSIYKKVSENQEKEIRVEFEKNRDERQKLYPGSVDQEFKMLNGLIYAENVYDNSNLFLFNLSDLDIAKAYNIRIINHEFIDDDGDGIKEKIRYNIEIVINKADKYIFTGVLSAPLGDGFDSFIGNYQITKFFSIGKYNLAFDFDLQKLRKIAEKDIPSLSITVIRGTLQLRPDSNIERNSIKHLVTLEEIKLREEAK